MEGEIKCMFPRRVDPDLVAQLPIVKCPDEIVLVQTPDQLDGVLSEIASESVLGFDTETRPSFSKKQHYKVAILQLAGASKAWVFRLEPLESRLSDIYKILENPDIIKAGLAVRGDIRSLSARMNFKAAGFVDISNYTSRMGIINTGMKNLAALFLGERVSKAAQMSNWDADLTPKQLDYAATDAWMSRRLYLEVLKVLESGRAEVEPEPDPIPAPFSFSKFYKEWTRRFGRIFAKVKRTVKNSLGGKKRRYRRRRGKKSR